MLWPEAVRAVCAEYPKFADVPTLKTNSLNTYAKMIDYPYKHVNPTDDIDPNVESPVTNIQIGTILPRFVVGMGEALWDVLPEGRQIGGAPANFAYHVSQFGLELSLIHI